MRCPTLLSLLFAAAPALAGIQPGATIDDALIADVTPEGFAVGAEIAAMFVPERIDVPGFSTGDFTDWICFNDDYFGIFGAYAEISINSLVIEPTDDGEILATALLTGLMNTEAAPALVEYDAFCFAGSCDTWVKPFPVYGELAIVFEWVDDGYGNLVLQGRTKTLFIDYEVKDSDIAVSGCSLADLIDIAGFFGISVTDLLTDQLDATVDDALVGASAELDAILADLFTTLTFEDSVELDTDLYLDIAIGLSDITITSEAMRIHLAGSTGIDSAHACVKPFDPGESLETPSDTPGPVDYPLGVENPHINALISDDFGNQALYALWQTGLICQDVDASLLGDALPLAFDTTLLPLLLGDSFDDLFEEPAPISMRTLPRKPPTMDLTDGVGVRVEDLGIAVFTEVQGRQVRLVDTSLSMTAGIDMNYETTTGFLGIGVDLSRGVNASVDVNEYRPDDDAEIEEALAGLMASPLISGAISAALGGLGVNMPSFALGEEFYGLEDMSIEIAGDEQDWIGAYTWLGPVPYESAGGCAGGCGDSGCDDSGCTDAAGCEDSGCTDKKGGCDPDALSDTSSCKGSDPYGTSDCGSCDSKKSSCDKGCSSASGALNGRILAVVFALVLVSLRRRRDD